VRRTGQTLRVDIEGQPGTVARVHGRRGHRRRRTGAVAAAVPPPTPALPLPAPEPRTPPDRRGRGPEHQPGETEKVGPTEHQIRSEAGPTGAVRGHPETKRHSQVEVRRDANK